MKFSFLVRKPFVHILCLLNPAFCAQFDQSMWGIGYFREK